MGYSNYCIISVIVCLLFAGTLQSCEPDFTEEVSPSLGSINIQFSPTPDTPVFGVGDTLTISAEVSSTLPIGITISSGEILAPISLFYTPALPIVSGETKIAVLGDEIDCYVEKGELVKIDAPPIINQFKATFNNGLFECKYHFVFRKAGAVGFQFGDGSLYSNGKKAYAYPSFQTNSPNWYYMNTPDTPARNAENYYKTFIVKVNE